jgi:hypothetical protein
MNTVELTQYSLGFALEILKQVTADLTQEQADWKPPGIVNTIGEIYSHIITYVDNFLQQALIERLPPPESVDQRADVYNMVTGQYDISELHAYADDVMKKIMGWLSSQTPEDLSAMYDTVIGELTIAQTIDAFIIWHINTHCGEISALKGCQGLTGYPW